jgi:uncharacterized protein involved in exopolysaccharide biosynthesis
MEFTDVARTMARYRWLILLFVVVGVGSAWLMHYGESKTYTASTRLVLDTPDPESRAESGVIADTAKAIATSPSQVREALTRARVTGRDPEEVARSNVSVRALGSSGIVQLSLRDSDPEAAAMIANALAAEVIETRLEVTQGQVQQVLRDLDRRIADLNRRISTLDAKISSLAVDGEAASDAASANAIRSQGDEAERLRDFLAQQRSVVEAERVGLLSSEALRPKSSVINKASTPSRADASRVFPDMVLGGLLALIIGVGVAGLIEMVRPTTVTGGSALARELDTPLLGTFSDAGLVDEHDLVATEIGVRLAFAADAAGVTNVRLLGLGRIDVDAIAKRLEAVLFAAAERPGEQRTLARAAEGQGTRGAPRGNARDLGRSVRITTVDPSRVSDARERTGVVAVSPLTLNAAQLYEALQSLRGTSLPLLGVIATTSTPEQSPRRFPSLLEGLKRLRTSA